jgi:hypothetical protein
LRAALAPSVSARRRPSPAHAEAADKVIAVIARRGSDEPVLAANA